MDIHTYIILPRNQDVGRVRCAVGLCFMLTHLAVTFTFTCPPLLRRTGRSCRDDNNNNICRDAHDLISIFPPYTIQCMHAMIRNGSLSLFPISRSPQIPMSLSHEFSGCYPMTKKKKRTKKKPPSRSPVANAGLRYFPTPTLDYTPEQHMWARTHHSK